MRILSIIFLCLVATSGHAGEWAVDSATGCKVWNANPQPNETVSWSGNCVGGTANGSGILKFYKYRKPSSIFEGVLKDGKCNGKGTYTWANGDKYVGEFKDDKRTGKGTYTHADGEKYVGEWKDGKRNGKGTYTYADGGKYVGEWKDGERNGKGTLTEANGDSYSGGFSKNEKHGEGTFTFKSGGSYKGLWQNGQQIKVF